MTTQHAARIDDDLINLDGGLFAATTAVQSAASVAPPKDKPSMVSLEDASRRRFRNVSMGIAAVAYSVSYLGTLAFLKYTRDAAPAVKAEVAAVAEARSLAGERPATSTSVSQKAPEHAAAAKPVNHVKPVFKAAAKREKASAKGAVAAGSVEARSHAEAAAFASLDAEAAGTAIAIAAARAGSCLKADDARTTMSVKVTFAPSGRVTTALLNGGPFMATEQGSCIARTLRAARVGAFDGGPVTVTRTVRVR